MPKWESYGLQLFDVMQGRNIMSSNILIGGFIQNEDLESARKVFDQMPEQNVATWDAMVMGLRVLNIGRHVHGYVVKSGFEFNLVVGSSLAHMYMREQLGLYLFRCKSRSSESN
ncbi:pentatricopeptide (PPR) repeat protein [Actinidia rufa]|uniref:Pentatricopeptide (PPR) repeat protein n=1 Tax=Actinidia rufa TaxID=165716 RepID=A0A7J0EGH7_9ERIC|nr:pentatricopeptide (PPR) repeat protein [Actinidia rufa]